jgi:hypothetical protein
MAIRSLLTAHACDHDLRADTREELDGAIDRITQYSSDIIMPPLELFSGKWRAIVRGPTVIFSADFDADTIEIGAVRGVRHVDESEGENGL